MSSKQQAYYRGRAVEERDAAALATESNVAGLHRQMAAMYDQLADEMAKESSSTNTEAA